MASQPVRVILNDRCLRNVRTGVGHYVSELLAALPVVAPDLDLLPFYRTYIDSGNSGEQAGQVVQLGEQGPIRAPEPPRRAPDRLRRVLQGGYEAAFRVAGRLKGYRLYHEPNHVPGPWDGPIITTIHDLSVLRHPEWHPLDRVRWYERGFLKALPRTAHFISVSEFTRREMMELLGIPAERITVIPEGPRTLFVPRPAEAVQSWLAGRRLPPEYLLFVGTMEPRKNLIGLLAAYVRLPLSLRERFPLLIVGAGGWGEERLEQHVATLGLDVGPGAWGRPGPVSGSAGRPDDHSRSSLGRVCVLGYVTDEDLGWLYAGARALVWPTLYEGFGLPPLECMAAGTPVITSDAASLPEVVGDAGLRVDPRDTQGLSNAIRRVCEDDALVEDLRARGLRRSRGFSWMRCAQAHADLYRRCAESTG